MDTFQVSTHHPAPGADAQGPSATDAPAGEALARLHAGLGFVPRLFHAQLSLPRLVEAESHIVSAVLLRDGALPRSLKALASLAVAVDRGSAYLQALAYRDWQAAAGHGPGAWRTVPRAADLTARERAVLAFARQVARDASSVTAAQLDALRALGLGESHIVEAVATSALALFQCTVAAGLGVEPDFDPPPDGVLAPLAAVATCDVPPVPPVSCGPAQPRRSRAHDDFPPLAFLRRAFGFVPNVFRAQMCRPDIVEAEVSGITLVLLTEDVLSRQQKERIFLVISAFNMNTHCVAAHCELLRGLGVPIDTSDQIAVDHTRAGLPARDVALLDAALALTKRPARFGEIDRQRLLAAGFNGLEVLEAVVMCGLAQFINAASMGLGAEPDFAPPPAFSGVAQQRRSAPRLGERARVTPAEQSAEDPDWPVIVRVKQGDVDAFEELVRRHGRRVQATLAGILRDDAELEDAVQDTFVKAFQHVAAFEGRSRFVTWLTRIAINVGLQRLRGRHPMESLDEDVEGDEGTLPRQVRAWQDDPEQAYSRAVMRDLVLGAVMRLPLKYRVVVMLRDLQQLSTAETAAALDLAVPGVKARLFRGRQMLRETLAPYFTRPEAREP